MNCTGNLNGHAAICFIYGSLCQTAVYSVGQGELCYDQHVLNKVFCRLDFGFWVDGPEDTHLSRADVDVHTHIASLFVPLAAQQRLLLLLALLLIPAPK